jgi:hypothetical protein
MATIKALSTYKYADHFNSRIAIKGKAKTSDEETDAPKETASVVKEIQAKAAIKKTEEKKIVAKTTPVKKAVVKKAVVKKAVVKKVEEKKVEEKKVEEKKVEEKKVEEKKVEEKVIKEDKPSKEDKVPVKK